MRIVVILVGAADAPIGALPAARETNRVDGGRFRTGLGVGSATHAVGSMKERDGVAILYGDGISGNCLKVKWVAAHLGVALDWRETDLMKGQTRTPEFLAMNPAGRIPTLVLDDGRVLSESNAIIAFLAQGSALIPDDPFARARMLQWMFWEQYSHEPYIAVRRFRLRYLGMAEADLDPILVERGNAALALMQQHLSARAFMVGEDASLADVALVAYTRMAPEGGFDLALYPAVKAWIARVEAELGIAY